MAKDLDVTISAVDALSPALAKASAQLLALMSDDQLVAHLAFLKIELNADYDKFPQRELSRSARILADIAAVCDEQTRRADFGIIRGVTP